MVLTGQRKRSVIFAIAFGVALIAVTVTLNTVWLIANWRSTLLFAFGVLCFLVVIAGLGFNTIFLVREIRRNEQHDAFINAVTHELKTPVASIRLYLQTLQQRDVDRTKQLEFVETMLADTDRLQTTIDQVLLAGKTGASGRPLNEAEIDVPEMVQDCLKLVARRHHLENGELSFESRLPDDERVVVMGDLDELKAAVSNLLDNAVKYSGDHIKVVVSVALTGAKKVLIQVRDEGIGITNDELKRVFRRFYRIPSRFAARVKGTGLGLAIVLSVAKRHGGRAYVESEGAGRGSVFTLELPLRST